MRREKEAVGNQAADMVILGPAIDAKAPEQPFNMRAEPSHQFEVESIVRAVTGGEIAAEQLDPAVEAARLQPLVQIAVCERLIFGEPVAVPQPISSMTEDGRH